MTALTVIGTILLCLLAGWGYAVIDERDPIFPWQGVYPIACLAALVMLYAGSYSDGMEMGKDKGQIDALKGIQTHEIHYVYPKGDTIPSDTLYLKIK